jgi:hypothetical protein
MCQLEAPLSHPISVAAAPTVNRPGMISTLVDDPRTADGVLRGELNLDKPLVPCEVWSDGCPTWALVSGSLGFQVTTLWMSDMVWTPAITKWFPNVVQRSGPRRMLWRRKTPRILLVDWSLLPPEDHAWWATTTTALILFCGKPKRGVSIPGWFNWSKMVSHSKCGGVTDGAWVVGVLSRIPLHDDGPVLPLRSRRPLLGILDTTTSGVPLRSPPVSSATTLEAVYLRPHLISPWGLLPVRQPKRLLCVASPAIPLYTRTGIARRPFSGAELGGAWDFPI